MITFIRLSNGVWGIRGTGLVEESRVHAVKKSGARKAVYVGKILRTNPDGSQVATLGKRKDRPKDEDENL